MDDILENDIQACLEQWWLEQSVRSVMVTGVQLPTQTREELWGSSIGKMLQILLQAANGQLDRTNQENLYLVQGAFHAIRAIFFKTASAPFITNSVWAGIIDTPIGRLLFLADLWVDRDELVTLKQVRDWTGYTLSSLSNRIARGKLVRYRDPNERNPTYATRIRFSDIYNMISAEDRLKNQFKEIEKVGLEVERRYLDMVGEPVEISFDPNVWLPQKIQEVVGERQSGAFDIYPYLDEDLDQEDSEQNQV